MIWIDAQFPPQIAQWINDTFHLPCKAIRDLGLRDADDKTIFLEAKKAGAIIVTKDSDFIHLIKSLNPPPKVIWLTCGNTSNQKLKEMLAKHLLNALEILKNESIIEIADWEIWQDMFTSL